MSRSSRRKAWTRCLAAITFTRPLDPVVQIIISSAKYASNGLPRMQLSMSTGARLAFIPDADDVCVYIASFRDMWVYYFVND